MPTLSNNFGASSIAGTVSPTSSLLTSKYQVTPNSSTVEHFFPFTDLQFSPADSSSREIATCRVPAVMHITVDSIKGKVKGGEGKPSNIGNGRESYPIDEGTFERVDDNYKAWLGSGMVDFLWGKDFLERDTGASFEQAFSEEEAVKIVADHPTLAKVAYVVTPRTVKFFYHDSMIRQVVSRMRELFESLGSAQPSVCFLGLGEVPNSAQRTQKYTEAHGTRRRGRSKSRKGNLKDDYKVMRPTRLWRAGALGWKGGRYQANGSIYIPMDYVPYNVLKKSARYNHILNQIGLEWMDSLKAVGSDWSGMEPPTGNDPGEDVAKIGVKEKIAMLNLFVSSLPSFGVTDNPAPSDAMLDDSTISTTVRNYLTMPFSSAYTHMDVGLLATLKKFTDVGGVISNDEKLFGKGAQDVFHHFLKNHFVFSIALACLEAKWKLVTYPAVFMYEGGPRPEHVQQRMMMNFRPDRDYGGGGETAYTLIPKYLNPGETKARVPTIMHLANEASGNSDDKQGLEPNQYLGPRDPVVITDVKASQYFGDRSETIIEDEFYYASPVITREGTCQSTYRNYRTVNIVNIQRPPFFTPGATVLGSLLGMCSHHSMVSGPVYEQVLGVPWYYVNQDLTRDIVLNNQYDVELQTRADPNSKKHIDERGMRMLKGQGHDITGLQARKGMQRRDNPQNKATKPVADENLADTDVIQY